MRPALFTTIAVTIITSLEGTVMLADESFSFDHDVMPILSRAGCNMGTCHGNLNGKGGLRLSLRGQDPSLDYLALTHELGGRRVNRNAPTQSLLLLKPVADVPHQGGQRFIRGSREYEIIRSWIANGTPPPSNTAPKVKHLEVSPTGLVVRSQNSPIQLTAIAHFSDGQQRDVTLQATYEVSNYVATIGDDGTTTSQSLGESTVSVRYLNTQGSVRIAFVPSLNSSVSHQRPSQNWIDAPITAKLTRLRVSAQPLATDAAFLRRTFLDTIGRLPTAIEARQFVTSEDPLKKSKLIDRLLADPGFADHWALKWSDLLRNEERVLDARGVQVFHRWIRDRFAAGMPLNEFVSQLVSASGSTYKNPPANFYRALRDPLSRGESSARLFLGVRLQCAKCHNHPFDHWTQDDYYSWASLFARVDYEVLKNERVDKFDKNEFNGEQIVLFKDEGEVTNPRSGAPAKPKYLSAFETPPITTDQRLDGLAAWLTDEQNLPFAQAQANRIWYHLMGRGLVDPVDDFRSTNPASHPELLNELAIDFVANGFDVQHSIRQIMHSAAYQSATLKDDVDELATHNYAGILPRRLAAEQLLDAQCQVLDTQPEFNGYQPGVRAGQLAGINRVHIRTKSPSEDERFLTLFGKPSRQMTCECERLDDTTLAQAFHLINGAGMQRRLETPNNRLSTWVCTLPTSEDIVKELFWTALSRPPNAMELDAGINHLETSSIDGLRDLTWAVLNAKEFLFRY